ncbi:MAG: acyl-ACP--UDP-N-acetylglucosamine O-acyltransferase [Chthoniobacteraceae bacterium]
MSGTKIHPTAVIDPGARIGEGCEVGPYCVIGADVELGEGCRLQHHVSLAGPSRFGKENVFFPFSTLGQRTQDLKYTSEPTHLIVGDGNTFREFVTVHRGTTSESSTRIGNRGYFLAYVHVAHDCTVGDEVVFSNNGTLAGHVEVGDFAILGGLTAVHQYCRIGAHAMTGGCSKIVQDVPPFMLADGNPAKVRSYNKVGMERRGFDAQTMRAVREAYRIIYRLSLNLPQAIDQMRADLPELPEIEQILAFVSSSQRGIIR